MITKHFCSFKKRFTHFTMDEKCFWRLRYVLESSHIYIHKMIGMNEGRNKTSYADIHAKKQCNANEKIRWQAKKRHLRILMSFACLVHHDESHNEILICENIGSQNEQKSSQWSHISR